MSLQHTVGPGARVVIRDEEWMVRRTQTSGGQQALTVVGLFQAKIQVRLIDLEPKQQDILQRI